jgi:dTDP-glucose 4,6-dehydratase
MILRPFNTYGPRQSARAIIPTIITQLLEGKEEIELGALEPTRDFSYISDTVNAYLSAIESKFLLEKLQSSYLIKWGSS